MAEVDYHVDTKLKRLWKNDMLEWVKKKNTDRVYVIDGRERLGKSTLAIQMACYLEPSLMDSPEKLVSRIAFTPEEFHRAVRETKNGVVIFDEAFRGLSSRGAMSKVNKAIIQTLMEMGQNNNIVFIVLPSIFMLDTYPAMHRSDFLFHIYADKRGNRCFVGYNHQDKNKIYQMGLKKGYNYLFFSRFRGRFFGKFPAGEEFEKAYLKKKAHALQNMFQGYERTPEPEIFIARTLREAGFEWKDIGKRLGIQSETIRIKVDRANKSLQSYEITPHTE